MSTGRFMPYLRHEAAYRTGKLEPTLHAFASQSGPADEEIPVIIQFKDDTAAGKIGSAPAEDVEDSEAVQERGQLILETGGIPGMSFPNIRAHADKVRRDALDRLVLDPLVARISVDHPVQASLGRTARALGANLVWMPPKHITGSNVTVAVIDSGVGEHRVGFSSFSHDLSPALVGCSGVAGGPGHADQCCLVA